MSRTDGKTIDDDLVHLHQSVVDILTTPIGNQVLRRDYGSRLFDLIDTGLNNSGVMDIYAATVTALALWENRLAIQNVRVTPGKGTLSLTITGLYKPNNIGVRISDIQVGGR